VKQFNNNNGIKNVFKNLLNNGIFLKILFSIIIIQLIIVKYGSIIFQTVKLSLFENFMCILLGIISLILNFVIKMFIS
jgi:hypothetical protein